MLPEADIQALGLAYTGYRDGGDVIIEEAQPPLIYIPGVCPGRLQRLHCLSLRAGPPLAG